MTASTGTTAPATTTAAPFAAGQKIGLWLLLVLNVLSALPFVGDDSSSSTQVGPPTAIVVLDGVLIVGTVVAVLVALVRRSRLAARIACGLTIVNALTAVPAFFADQPAGIVVMAAVFIILAAVGIVLTLRGTGSKA